MYDCLRRKSCALCIADADELPNPGLVDTSDWGYMRLRREAYTDEDLRNWIDMLRSKKWNDAYVFFKHEDAGTGPKLAARFLNWPILRPTLFHSNRRQIAQFSAVRISTRLIDFVPAFSYSMAS